jgi:polar amino acid transport system substrate-binding protein
MELASYPTQRIGALLNQGSIDAETARARIYAQAHPELIRVDESVFDIAFALYAANPAIAVKRLEDLRTLKPRAGYPRGVLYCEKALQSVLPPEQIFDTTQTAQGLLMLLSGRVDVFCAVDLAVQGALAESADLKRVTGIRQLMVLEAAPLYPYLHRKHAELAPRLAATLKEMKAEGLIERYRTEALREAGR